VEYLELYLASSRSGVTPQPLNWRLAPRELGRIIADAEPRALFYHREYSGVADELRRVVDIADWIELNPGEPSQFEDLIDQPPRPVERASSEIPALVLYTGGTSGVSKGVLHSHASIQACLINETVADRIRASDVYLLLGQLFHIPAVKALTYLSHGRPVVLLNFEPRTALEVIEQERVSSFIGISTMLNHLLADPTFDQHDLSSLRLVGFGGGPMGETTVREALERLPCELMQSYGMTEGGSMTFMPPHIYREALDGDRPERLRSCGVAAYLSEVRVVKPTGELARQDNHEIGEIIVKSPANMVGYWRRQELTDETLRDGWLRTGDLATWDEDQLVYIVDRAKDMIVSGGENIYPAQVEAAIYMHPAVLEVAVIGIPDPEWGESVKAVVVRRPSHDYDEDRLREELVDLTRRELASYMKPKVIEFVDALPKGPTGKVLKRELR
jgi:long-chain acyl-CoA synthetase